MSRRPDYGFIKDQCVRVICLKYDEAMRGRVITTETGSMWYESGRLIGYLTAFGFEYDASDEAITIRDCRGGVLLQVKKIDVLGSNYKQEIADAERKEGEDA